MLHEHLTKAADSLAFAEGDLSDAHRLLTEQCPLAAEAVSAQLHQVRKARQQVELLRDLSQNRLA